MEEQSKFPEAIASVSYTVKTGKGFPVVFTMRGQDEDSLLDRMKALEAQFEAQGFTADIKSGGFPKKEPKEQNFVEGRKCPKCGSRLVDTTTSTGKRLFKCETQKWDYLTKTTKGCDFVEWQDTPVADEGASEAQKRVLISKGIWVEGTTKAEATELLATLK